MNFSYAKGGKHSKQSSMVGSSMIAPLSDRSYASATNSKANLEEHYNMLRRQEGTSTPALQIDRRQQIIPSTKSQQQRKMKVVNRNGSAKRAVKPKLPLPSTSSAGRIPFSIRSTAEFDQKQNKAGNQSQQGTTSSNEPKLKKDAILCNSTVQNLLHQKVTDINGASRKKSPLKKQTVSRVSDPAARPVKPYSQKFKKYPYATQRQITSTAAFVQTSQPPEQKTSMLEDSLVPVPYRPTAVDSNNKQQAAKEMIVPAGQASITMTINETAPNYRSAQRPTAGELVSHLAHSIPQKAAKITVLGQINAQRSAEMFHRDFATYTRSASRSQTQFRIGRSRTNSGADDSKVEKMHDTTGQSLRAPAQLNSSSIEVGSIKNDQDLVHVLLNEQSNACILQKEDCTVSSSSRDSGANVKERLRQIELNQQRTNEAYDNYMALKETNTEMMRDAAGTQRYAEATMSTKLLKKESEMTPKLVRGVLKTKRSPVKPLLSDEEDVGSPALLKVVPLGSTKSRLGSSKLEVRPASRVPLKSGVCFSGMPRTPLSNGRSLREGRVAKVPPKKGQNRQPQQKQKGASNANKTAAAQPSQDSPLLGYSLCCRRADTTRNALPKGHTVDEQLCQNRLETVSLAYSNANEPPKATMEGKRDRFPFAAKPRKRSVKLEHSNESSRDEALSKSRAEHNQSEHRPCGITVEDMDCAKVKNQTNETERARIEQLNMNLIRANNAENQRHGTELIRVRYQSGQVQNILRRAGVSTSSDRQQTDWHKARRINVVPEFTKNSIMTSSSHKDLPYHSAKVTSEARVDSRGKSPPQMPSEVTFCNAKPSVLRQKPEATQVPNVALPVSPRLNPSLLSSAVSQSRVTQNQSAPGAGGVPTNINTPRVPAGVRETLDLVYYAAYDEDMHVPEILRKIDVNQTWCHDFKTIKHGLQLCFDQAVSDHPFTRTWKEPSPQSLKQSQIPDESLKDRGVRCRLYLMERQQLLNLLEIKALDGAETSLSLTRGKRGEYYISQVLNEQACDDILSYVRAREDETRTEQSTGQRSLDQIMRDHLIYLHYNCARKVSQHKGFPVYMITNDQSQLPLELPNEMDYASIPEQTLDMLNRYHLFTRIRVRKGAPTVKMMEQVNRNHQLMLQNMIRGLVNDGQGYKLAAEYVTTWQGAEPKRGAWDRALLKKIVAASDLSSSQSAPALNDDGEAVNLAPTPTSVIMPAGVLLRGQGGTSGESLDKLPRDDSDKRELGSGRGLTAAALPGKTLETGQSRVDFEISSSLEDQVGTANKEQAARISSIHLQSDLIDSRDAIPAGQYQIEAKFGFNSKPNQNDSLMQSPDGARLDERTHGELTEEQDSSQTAGKTSRPYEQNSTKSRYLERNFESVAPYEDSGHGFNRDLTDLSKSLVVSQLKTQAAAVQLANTGDVSDEKIYVLARFGDDGEFGGLKTSSCDQHGSSLGGGMMLGQDSLGGEGMPPISRLSSVLQDHDRPRNFESMCSVPGTSYRGVDVRALEGRPNARYDITASEPTVMTPLVGTTPRVEGSKHSTQPTKFNEEDKAITLQTDDMINLRQPRTSEVNQPPVPPPSTRQEMVSGATAQELMLIQDSQTSMTIDSEEIIRVMRELQECKDLQRQLHKSKKNYCADDEKTQYEKLFNDLEGILTKLRKEYRQKFTSECPSSSDKQNISGQSTRQAELYASLRPVEVDDVSGLGLSAIGQPRDSSSPLASNLALIRLLSTTFRQTLGSAAESERKDPPTTISTAQVHQLSKVPTRVIDLS